MSVIFSVIVPCYNRSSQILTTLQSVRHQTFRDFECIIVDDGSDDSEQLRSVVEGLNDARFSYIWQANAGASAARNAGIDAARGKFVAFLDSDDEFLPKKLERFLLFASEQPTSAYYSRAFVDRGVKRLFVQPDRGIRAEESMGEYLYVDNQFIQTTTLVVSTDVARQVRFDTQLMKGEDPDFCVRLQTAGVRFHMIDEVLSIWHDVDEKHRLSYSADDGGLISWLDRAGPLLSAKAVYGYRATVLAYHVAARQPLLALRYLFTGLFLGRVPVKVTARQVCRCFLPRHIYRRLVNGYVALRGYSCKARD